MYRILFIETGEYLYCSETTFACNLYSKYEVDALTKFHGDILLKIYEVLNKKEAVKKLTNKRLNISTNDTTDINIYTNLPLFEIVEV